MNPKLAVLENPLTHLSRESNSVKAVIEELEGNLTKLAVQLEGLKTVRQAIENEMDRLRANPAPADQLEFELEE
jgi:chromosome segregation ATPase